mgnify:CR=1 FL=1
MGIESGVAANGRHENGQSNSPVTGTFAVKAGLAQMLKGGVIMDVVTAEQARIAEEAGACAVMALMGVAACAVIGVGVATLFPAAMHAATRIPGVRPAMGVATVSWLARAGFVVAPLAVGAVAERLGIAWGLTVPILAAFLLVPLSSVLRPRASLPLS